MIRLGLDATQRVSSCAISTESGIVAAMTMDNPIENLTILIQQTLRRANIALDTVDEIVACVGPGSQMGTRATVVVGNALALASGKPITGVLSADALALTSMRGMETATIAVSAGKRRWHVTKYRWMNDKLRRLEPLRLLDNLPSDASPLITSDFIREDRSNLCAQGILMVADAQRDLIAQSMVREVMPYERGVDDGN